MDFKKLKLSFKYAFNGLFSALYLEQNMRIHYFAMIMVIMFGIIYKINNLEWIIVLICFGLVMSAEMMNTAIEKTIDINCKEYNNDARIAKDIAAGGVLVMAIITAIIGLIIFIPKIF
jgi:undecaprenol kinase